MRMKWFPLQAVAFGTALSLSILITAVANADPPSSPSAPPASEQGAQNTRPPDPYALSTSPAASPKAPSATPDRHLTRGEVLAHTALSYRGVPYRWGGASVRSGFDCSGLVQTVYAKWGILLPRVAHLQYRTGNWVKRSALQPGDLVFFKDTYKRGLSHVGIYIGDGFFIHAPGRGKTVSIARLDDKYHSKHWAGARRLDLSKLPEPPGEKPEVKDVVIEPPTPADADKPAQPAASDPGDNEGIPLLRVK